MDSLQRLLGVFYEIDRVGVSLLCIVVRSSRFWISIDWNIFE